MEVKFTKKYNEKKCCSDVLVTLPEVKVSEAAIIIEAIRTEVSDLPAGEYKAAYDPKTMELKITSANVEA